MGRERIHVLLIEDNPGDARLIQETLAGRDDRMFCLTWEGDLGRGLDCLAAAPIDVVLLDLSLPGTQGLDTLSRVLDRRDDVPVIVLTGLDDEALSVEAVRRGAQDYLVKGETGGPLLARAIRYAIQRKETQDELADANARLEEANRRLEELATTDDLTGLWNRRYFLDMLSREFQRVARTGASLAVVMIDVDHFKHVNDTCGHPFGDRVLCNVAHAMQQEARTVDLVARFGGEEFMILMPETDARRAAVAAERLRLNVADRAIEGGRQTVAVTISLGVASFDEALDPTVLLRHVDDALYAAKEGGRNRTMVWTEVGPRHADDVGATALARTGPGGEAAP